MKITVSTTPEMMTHAHIRVIILSKHSYAVQVSDDLINWRDRQIVSNEKRILPEGVVPGVSELLK
jgi:hypothetical protein